MCSTIMAQEYKQLGNDISAISPNKDTNSFVSISGNGGTMAIGNGVKAIVYDYNSLNNTWEQKGNVIQDSLVYNVSFGLSIDLNYSGNKLILNLSNGAVAVYEHNTISDNWDQTFITDDLNNLKQSVSINDSGDIIAFGSSEDIITSNIPNLYGRVYVFEKVNGNWLAKGDTIISTFHSYGRFGTKVELNSAGDHVMISSLQYDNNLFFVYEYSNGSWSWKGNPRSDNNELDITNITINDSANRFAFCSEIGVMVFDFQNGGWVNTKTIAQETTNFYQSVDLSADGFKIAYSNPYDTNSSGDTTGIIYIYDLLNDVLIDTIFGLVSHSPFGKNVSLSAEGSIVASSSRDISKASAYTSNQIITGINLNTKELLYIYPNPTSDFIKIEGIKANTSINILDSKGKVVKVLSNNGEPIDIKELPQGEYYLNSESFFSRFIKI